MRRREFITPLGSTAAGWPLAAPAQQQSVKPLINSASPSAYAPMVAAFQRGLNKTGVPITILLDRAAA
jgi:putative ABC transport system substrate-binding protein